MKIKKILLYFAGVIFALMLLISVVLLFIDFNHFKPQIQKIVKESTGRTLKIDGDIHINILPGFHLTVDKVTLDNSKGFSDPHMIKMDRLQIYISLIDLLRKKITLKKLSLKRPKIYLETRGASNNWDSLVQQKKIPSTDKGKEKSESFKFSSVNFSISDAEFSYKNGAQSYFIDDFNGYGSFELNDNGKIYTSGKLSIKQFIYASNGSAKNQAQKKSESKKTPFKGWSQKPIELPAFVKNLESDLRLQIEKVKYNRINLMDSDFKFSSSRGSYSLSGETNAEGILMSVTSSKKNGQDLLLNLKSSMRNGDAGLIFSKLGVEDIKTKKTKMSVEGDIDFNIDLSAKGKSIYSLMKSTMGDIQFNLDKGAFKGFNVNKVKEKVKNVDNFLELLGLVFSDFFVGQTDIDKFAGKIAVKNGVMQSQGISLVADGVKGNGTTYVNLPAFTGDIKLNLKLDNEPKFPEFKGGWKGSLSNLDFSFNKEEFIGFFAEKSVNPLNNLPKPLETLKVPGKILEGIFGK